MTTALVAATSPETLQAQTDSTDYCTHGVNAIKAAKYPYENRGTRCEGIYERKDSGVDELVAVSITAIAVGQPIGKVGSKTVALAWALGTPDAAAAKTPLSVRAAAEIDNSHYQMNTRLPFGAGRYEWPSDVLGGLKLPLEKVRFIASFETSIGSKPHQTVNVPLRIGETTAVTHYRFVLSSSQDLNSISYVVERLDGDHWTLDTSRVHLPKVFHPSIRPFAVDVPVTPQLKSGSYYRIKVIASLDSAEAPTPLACSAVFFHG